VALEIIITADGSSSLFNSELNETYHSTHGAIQESTHVFIKAGLDYLLQKHNPEQIEILEVGFGTGLNALLTLQRSFQTKCKISYTSLETVPLPEVIWSTLNYANSINLIASSFAEIHKSPWNTASTLTDNFSLLKVNSSLKTMSVNANYYDLIFFDAFAPSKQPDMWELCVLEKVVESMKAGGVYVTYCAKGQLKRDLRSLGLAVESLPGPPGKMQMIRATK